MPNAVDPHSDLSQRGQGSQNDRAAARALDFLARGPFLEGEISLRCRTAAGESPDPTTFAIALAMLALARVDDDRVRRFLEAARARLLRERERGGLWRFWPRDHPRHGGIPPDLDDSCGAALAIRLAGGAPAIQGNWLRGQRDAAGRFHTWIFPRRLRDRYFGVLAPLRSFGAAGHAFWRNSEARPGDVDAGANAHALAWLAGDGMGREAARWLCRVVEEGTEGDADKWYRREWIVRSLIARAVSLGACGLDSAMPVLARRVEVEVQALVARGDALELASAANVAAIANAREGDREALLSRLLEAQSADGSFPDCAVWFGGPRRTVEWGSPELTTVFALEALSRSGASPR